MMHVPCAREPHPVALAPDAGVGVEVGGAVARAVVAPQLHRHRGHRLPDHQLAQLAHDLVPVEVERGRVDGEAAAGDLAAVDRHHRAAGDDPAAHVGAAGAVDQQHVRAELLVDVVVALAGQRRAGRGDQPHAATGRGRARGCSPALRQAIRNAGASPMWVAPVSSAIRHCESRRRVAVHHHDRRAHEQRADERVPHHPGGRRELEQPRAGLQVPGQPEVLAVLDEDAAVAVDDRLRQPGRAGAEQDVQRVVERDRLERQLAGLRGQLLPAGGVVAVAEDRRVLAASAARRGWPRAPRAGRPACRDACSR